MDGVDARLLCDVEDLVDAQVRLDGPLPPAHQVRLVRLVAVLVDAILFAVDGDSADPELGAGAEDADRDLPPVRAHDLGEALRRGRLHSARAYAARRFAQSLLCRKADSPTPQR